MTILSRDLLNRMRPLAPAAGMLVLWLLLAGEITAAGLGNGLLVGLALAAWARPAPP